MHAPSRPMARSPRDLVTLMSRMRDVRAESGVSLLSVATDPSTLMSIVAQFECFSHTSIAWAHSGRVEVDAGSHFMRQAFRAHGAPTKASRSTHGKSAPEKMPSPRVIRRDAETGSIGGAEAVSYTHLTLPTIYSV